MNFDNKQIEDFKKVIEDIVDAQIKKHRITTYVAAIVKDVHTIGQNTVDVVIPPDTTRIITGIQNKTGESLEIGDSVEICTKNGTLSNAWVAVKHGTSSSSGGGGGNYILDDLPIGAQFAYSSVTNIPEGCLVCDGSAVSRTDYSELFAVIGTTYGEGDGSTTFNLPDKRGRISVGLDTGQSEFDTLGKHIGEKSHTLTVQEMPNHNHNSLYWNGYGISLNQISDGNYGLQWNAKTAYDTNAFTVGATGGSQAHNNIQPSEVDIWLIKAKQRATNILPDAIIYNGLDSTSTTDALSANMGKVLNDKFKNNMGNIIVESISSKNLFNINDVRQKSSNYSISKNSINISFIDGNAGYVKFNIIDNINNDYTISFNNNGNMIRLLIVPYDSSNNIIANLTIEGFTYNSLYQAFYGDTFSNSLSISLNSNVAKFQIGFVCIVNPSQTISNIQLEKGNEATKYTDYKTFGIVESGSNDNGSWIKYADGTMICTQKISLSGLSLNQKWGVLYYNVKDIPNYPQTFISPPTISYGSDGNNTFLIGNGSDSTNITLGAVLICAPDSRILNTHAILHVTATGRWK